MRINLFTAQFPYTKNESFIENELPVISNLASSVKIFPLDCNHLNEKRNIPVNSTTHNHIDLNDVKLTFSDYLLMIKILSIEWALISKKVVFLKTIRTLISLLKKNLILAKKIERSGFIQKNEVFYSYWMNDWATVLLILKMKNKVNHFIFRCGGFDIWNERHPGNYMPFRAVIYKYTSGVYPNSQTAEKYLKNLKLYPEKIKHQYWGTTDHCLCPFDQKGQFTIVSCSNLIPLKRVELIVDILIELSFKVKWIHFGGGPEHEKLSEKIKSISDFHDVSFKGHISNQKVLNFYKSNSINLFITTSSTEGLPVSVQESISFGIPILATNVGGMAEIVTNETGILIPAKFKPDEVAKRITEFKDSQLNTLSAHEKIRSFWLNKFDAKLTYSKFYQTLESVFKN